MGRIYMNGGRATRVIALAAAALLLPLAEPVLARAPPVTSEALLDRIQIQDLMSEYYALLNGRVVHDVAAYYTENAVLIANGGRMVGRAAIGHFYDTNGDPRVIADNRYTMILSNPRVAVRGAKATMECIWTGYLSDNIYTAPRLVEQGTETTEFEKRNGVWLITSRTITHLGGMPHMSPSGN